MKIQLIVNRKAGRKKTSAMLWTLTAPTFPELKTAGVITGSNNEDSTLTEGTINYDVRFDAIAPTSEGSTAQKDVIRLIINVEAQTAFNPGFLL